jgi:hypothetical protein
VTEVWVPNASPVIVLAKVGHLALLNELTDELLLPDAVIREVLAGPALHPRARHWRVVGESDTLQRPSPTNCLNGVSVLEKPPCWRWRGSVCPRPQF